MFLKGLIRGQRNISEIIPSRHFLLTKYEEDDFYQESKFGCNRKWSEKDIEEHKKLHPKDVFAVIGFRRQKTSKDETGNESQTN